MKKALNFIAMLIIASIVITQAATAQTPHLKKDGTVDKRYSGSKTVMATTAAPTKTSVTTTTTGAHMKADGSPDKRYISTSTATASAPTTSTTTASGHMKADGSPDKRYKTSSTVTTTAPASVARPNPAPGANNQNNGNRCAFKKRRYAGYALQRKPDARFG